MAATSRYIDRIFQQSHIGRTQLLEEVATGFFQSARNYTQCLSAVTVLLEHCPNLQGQTPGAAYVIGDGQDPQTAYLIARRLPHFTVYSVDPRLREGYVDPDRGGLAQKLLPNMVCKKCLAEEVVPTDPVADLYLIVGVCSHGPLQNLYDKLSVRARTIAITLPCCTDDANLRQPPTASGTDTHIIGTKNSWYLWDSDANDPHSNDARC